MSTSKLEWSIIEIDGQFLIVVKRGAEHHTPTKEEAERAVRLLNEEGNSVIRLFCQTPECPDKGGWIERTRKQADTQVFHCAVCGKKMER